MECKILSLVQRIASISDKIAGKRPDYLFKTFFYDINEKAKKYIDEQSKVAVKQIEDTLKKDLADSGYVGELYVKLGKFKGHPYITSAKIKVSAKENEEFTDKDDEKVKKCLNIFK